MALPIYLTNVVQPLDLSVFKPFKAVLKKDSATGARRTEARASHPLCL